MCLHALATLIQYKVPRVPKQAYRYAKLSKDKHDSFLIVKYKITFTS